MIFDLPPPDPAIELVVASRGMSKGIAQTEGPQALIRPSLQMDWLQVGGQWKNLSSPVAGGEASAFLGVAPKFGQFQVNLTAAYKLQTGVRGPTDNKSWEFTGNVSRKFNRLTLRVQAIYSPDDLGGAKRSIYVEGGPIFDLDKTTRISANIGRRDRVLSDDYTTFNAGITKTLFKGFTLDGRFYGTNQSDIDEFHEDRLVVTARMSF